MQLTFYLDPAQELQAHTTSGFLRRTDDSRATGRGRCRFLTPQDGIVEYKLAANTIAAGIGRPVQFQLRLSRLNPQWVSQTGSRILFSSPSWSHSCTSSLNSNCWINSAAGLVLCVSPQTPLVRGGLGLTIGDEYQVSTQTSCSWMQIDAIW